MTEKVYFTSDYVAGAHPEVLTKLIETNLESLPGYGSDKYCEIAKQKIRDAVGIENADVEFIAGGTQTNMTVISTMLRDYEGVISAETGHIGTHEAGAVENSGHKVIPLPQHNGKIAASDLKKYLDGFYADPSREHTVFPGMVYISYPTEYGTLYSKRELTEISGICRKNGILLYVDGARLGYGLMSRESDLNMRDIADLCDVFYIGGTKVGALCGEAVVFTRGNRPEHFLTSVKKRGALLAKGRLLSVQFDALFTDGLYYRIGKHGIDAAERLKDILVSHGIRLFVDSPTNQQFAILDSRQVEKIGEKIAFEVWERLDDGHSVVRFVTSWSTTDDDMRVFDTVIEEVTGKKC